MTPPAHHFERQVPFWFVPRFMAQHGVLEREREAMPALPRDSRVLNETHAYLRFPFFGRISALLHGFARDEGVELRSPLLDSRVVAFAAERPWSERIDGRETKILLRRAMRGLLPESLLAPRERRTGVTSAYFLRQLRGPGRAVVEGALKDPRLADLGMIDVGRLRRAWEHVLANDDDETGVRIFFTIQAELWLRSHEAA
jgi:asparagine synthetase B (glutamine-hydrolysing)